MRLFPFIWYFLFATGPGQILVVIFCSLWLTPAVTTGAIAQPRVSTIFTALAGIYAAVKLVRRLLRR